MAEALIQHLAGILLDSGRVDGNSSSATHSLAVMADDTGRSLRLQMAANCCTQLQGSVPRGQNSMCSATGRHVFPRELHTEPVWTEVSGRVRPTVQWGYTLSGHLWLYTFASRTCQI